MFLLEADWSAMGRSLGCLVGVQSTRLVPLGLVVGCVVGFRNFESLCSGSVDPVSEFLRGDVVIWWCTACDL